MRKPAAPASNAEAANLAELVVRTKPSHHPICLAFSPNGTLLASGSKDMNIDLWSTGSARELRSLRGHTHEVTSLAFAPDGKRLASGSRDGTARLWEIERGTTLATFRSGQIGLPLTVCFCADPGLLLCSSDDNTVTVWELSGAHPLHVARLPYRFADRRVVHAPLQWIAQCHGSGSVALWDLANGTQLWDADLHDDTPGALAFSPDGRLLAVGFATTQQTIFIGGAGKEPPPQELRDFAILLVDAASGKKLRELRGHTANVTALAFDASGAQLLSAAADHSLRLWSTATGRQLSQVAIDGFEAAAVAVAPDGATLASAERAGEFVGRIGLWEGGLAARRAELARHIGDVNPVVFSQDGRWLVTAGEDGHLNLWPLDRAEGPRVLVGHTRRVFSLALSPDGTVLASAAWDGFVRLWRFPEGQPLAQYERDSRDNVGKGDREATILHPGEPTLRALHALAFSPDGRHLACAGYSARIQVLRVPQATLARHFGDGAVAPARTAHGREDEHVFLFDIFALAYSPDGRRLATACTDNTIKMRDAATGRVLRTLAGHTAPVFGLVFSPDSRLLASGSSDQTVRLWDARSGRQRFTLAGHAVPGVVEKGSSVDFSPDGQTLASGGADGTLRLWNVNDGRSLSVAQGHFGAIASVRFSPDGQHVACGSNDAAATLWDVTDRTQPRRLAALFSFADGSWAVVDAEGRFDASDGGENEWLHWAVGLETVGLEQLKDRYYEPGLLPKLLRREATPLREVARLREVALHPRLERVAIEPTGLRSRVGIVDQGGGIGRIEVFVNGKQVRLSEGAVPLAARDGKQWLDIDLAGHPQLVPGVDNLCEVRAHNAQGYLVSRRLGWHVRGQTAPAAAPEFWAVVVGVSHYRDPVLDLHFAAKDAQDVAHALSLAARRLFGPDRVHIRVLASPNDMAGNGQPPTRENILAALRELTRAKSTDVLLLYMAGHGTSSTGPDGEYLFLTSDARSTRFDDPALRAVSTISAAELSDCVRSSPVLKQVLVLDTCAAGAVVGQLQTQRAVPSSQVRAIERLKDSTGLHILAGSAADAVSYESSRFGQGLLTYSLLLGMRGAALLDDGTADVSRLFGFAADMVPELAHELGGIQRPHIAAPRSGQSFPIGSLTPEDRKEIPLANPKPLVLRASFAEAHSWRDDIGLGRLVNEELRHCSERARDAPVIFVDAPEGALPGAVFVAGRYEIEGERVGVEVRATRDGLLLGSFKLHAEVCDATALGEAIVASVQGLVLGTSAPV